WGCLVGAGLVGWLSVLCGSVLGFWVLCLLGFLFVWGGGFFGFGVVWGWRCWVLGGFCCGWCVVGCCVWFVGVGGWGCWFCFFCLVWFCLSFLLFVAWVLVGYLGVWLVLLFLGVLVSASPGAACLLRFFSVFLVCLVFLFLG
ncbi:hypothetical protein, partial [Neisseria sp. P0016.S006]|uniref:hypothetical protein n=1 Tax=Neisseria sp. P0016.S006 TaxID=3436772 RepID=UPI003F7EDF43